MKIANITYEEINELYEKLNVPVENFRDKSFGINYFDLNLGDSVSTDRTSPYDEFVDMVCTSR